MTSTYPQPPDLQADTMELWRVINRAIADLMQARTQLGNLGSRLDADVISEHCPSCRAVTTTELQRFLDGGGELPDWILGTYPGLHPGADQHDELSSAHPDETGSPSVLVTLNHR